MGHVLSSADHKWSVGDLCTMTYGGVGEGLIYRVTEVRPANKHMQTQLAVTPVLGVIASTKGRKPRGGAAAWCKPLSLVDLACEYHKLGEFIAEEATRRGA